MQSRKSVPLMGALHRCVALLGLLVAVGAPGPVQNTGAVSQSRPQACTSTMLPGGTRRVRVCTGWLGGAAYRIEVPSRWNGTLALWSHGTTAPGSTNPAQEVGTWLLAHGYALAGSSFSTTGWAVETSRCDHALRRHPLLLGDCQAGRKE